MRGRSRKTPSAHSRNSGRSASSRVNRSSATRRGCACATPRSSRCGRRWTAARRCGSTTSSPAKARRASARVDPLAVVLHEGRWHLHAHDHAAGAPAPSCSPASSAASSPCPGSTFTRRRPGIQDRVIAELDELRLRNVGRPRGHRRQRRRGAARQARGAARRGRRGASGCTTPTSTCSPTNWPATAPRCACSPPDTLRDAVHERLRAVADHTRPAASRGARPMTAKRAEAVEGARQARLPAVPRAVPDRPRQVVDVAEAAEHFGVSAERSVTRCD